MSSYEDRLRERRNKYKDPISNGSQQEKVSPADTSKYDDRIAQRKGKYSDPEVDDSFIKSFLSDAKKFADDAVSVNARFGYGTSSKLYNDRKKAADDLQSRGWKISQYLAKNKDKVPEEYYKSLSDYLDGFSKYTSQTMHSMYRSDQYFSKFKTEDDYKAYLAQQKDYEEKSKFDVKSGQDEINLLEDELKRLRSERTAASSFRVVDNAYLGSPYAAAQQGNTMSKHDDRIRELENQISQKKQYLNQAKHIQEGITLSSVSGNADFKDFSGYVSTHDDGVWSKLTSDYGMGYKDLTYEYINDQNGIRDEIKRKHRTYDKNDDESVYEAKGYDYLKENEIAIYNYYYAKDGKEKAQEYLDSIQETLNLRKATGMFETMEGNAALELAFGVAAGIDQWKSGTKNLFNTEDDYIAQTAYQMASGMVREDLADDGFKLPDWLGGASIGQVGYDAITTTANMAPSMLTSMAANMVAPGSGAIIGNAMMFASSAGNAYQEALNLGYDKGQARAYSTLVGASEAGLQYLLGGISSMGGKVSGKALSKMLDGINNAFARTALKVGGNMLSEGFEEGLQEVLTPLFKNWTLKADEDINWSEVAYSGLLGALTAGFMEGPTTIAGEVKTYSTGKQLQAADISAERLAEIGKTFAADTVAYQLAGKVDKNTGAYTMGRLFNEIGATLTEQNVNDITNALVAKGMDEVTAKKNAKAMAMVVEGGNLTDLQVAVIESNEVLAEAVRTTIIDSNATWFQRTNGYNEALMALAQEKTASKASSTEQSLTGQENMPASEAVDTQNKNGAESLSEVDTSPSKVRSISSIQKGVATVKLEDGSEVSVRDADLDPDDGVRIETIAKIDGISTEDANFVLNTLRAAPSANAQVDALGAKEAYKYGYYGFSQEHIAKHGVFANSLNETQRQAIYQAGQKARQMQVASKQFEIEKSVQEAQAALAKESSEEGKASGRTYMAVLDDGITALSLDESQKASYRLADQIAEAAKVNIRVYLGKTGEHGYYNPKTDEIYLNLNATNKSRKSMMTFTLGHELVHRAKKGSPAKYEAFANFLIEQYGKHGSSVETMIAEELAAAKEYGIEMTYEKAFEEVVCNACQRMLLDTDAGQKLAEFAAQNKQNKSFLEDVKRWIMDFLDKLRSIFQNVEPDSLAAKEFAKFDESVKQALAKMYVDMTIDAGENLSTIQNAFGKGTVVETNEHGEFTMASSKDGSEKLFNLVTWKNGGRETLEATLLREGYTEDEVKAALTIMDEKQRLVESIANEVDENGKLTFPEQGRINKATLTTDLKDGHSVLSALVSNGDYHVNIDLLMVCKKRKAYQRVINRLCETGLIQQATVDALAIAEINKILGKYGFETACLGCFVESRRLRIQEWAQTICKEWNAEVKKRNPNAKAFGFGKGEATLTPDEVMKLIGELESGGEKNDKGNLNLGQGSAVKRMGVLMDKVPSLQRTLSIEDLITPDGLTSLRSFDSNLFSMVKSRYGSNSPKFVQEFNPYNHELAKYGKVPTQYESLREYLYAIGGARMQSFSDFIIENWFDYCQIVADLAARKLPMHTYTKEIALAKLFGLTGIKINMSLIPDVDRSLPKEFAGLTRNSKGELELIWADKDRFKATGGKSYMQSINFADAIALQNDPRYSANVGTIAVGISDKHIEIMLDDARIRMIIPYHSSGMNPIFADLMGTSYYKDYTNFQNTTIKQIYNSKGQKVTLKLDKTQVGNLTSGFQFNEVLQDLGDARAAAEAYKEWCADASKHTITIKGETYTAELTPKFNDFSGHQNYYKLLEDFNTYDCISEQAARQGDVQQIYPEDFDKILKDELKAQEKHRQKQEESQAFDKAMGEIESYLKNHSKADTVYYAKQHGIKLGDKDKKLNAAEKEKLKKLQAEGASFSLPRVDSDGNQLSKEQQEYFKDSVVRDSDGNLLVMYHGTADGGAFTVFDGDKLGNSSRTSQIGQGFYFTNVKKEAEAYTKNSDIYGRVSRGKNPHLHQVYLNITNPFNVSTDTLDIERVKSVFMDGTYDYFFDSWIPFYLNKKVVNGEALTKAVLQSMTKEEKVSLYVDYYAQIGTRDLLSEMVRAFPSGKQSELLTAMKTHLGYDGIVDEFAPGQFQYVAFSSEQIKDANNQNPTSDPDIRYSLPRAQAPAFYSHMTRVVDGVKQEKLGAASVVSMLRGKGVKAEEIKWSGIETFLEGKKSVTKAELQEFIAGSMLQIEEETLDDKDRPYTEDQQKRLDEYEAKRDEVAKRLAAEWKKITGKEFPVRNPGAGLESTVVNKIIDANKEHKDAAFEGRLLKKLRNDLKEVIANNDDFGFDSWKDALRAIHRHRRDFSSYYEMSANDKAVLVKYCNALNAYNELPNLISDVDTDRLRAIALEADPWTRKIMEVKHEHNEEEAKYMTNWRQYSLEGGKNYREMLFRIPGSTYTNEAMMTHWKERKGVLAHARVQDMNTFIGKMLFIEEIQSDWHNEGHKSGYRDPRLEDKYTLSKKMEKYTEEFYASPIADVVRERIGAIGYEGAGVSMILNFLLDSHESMMSTLNTLSRKGASFTESEVNEIAEYAHEYEEMYHKWETAPGDLTAPDAPFSDTYHEYVMKRLLREAAEQDYDSIGWTTAETQDERWANNRPHKEGEGKSGFLKGYTIEYDQDIPKFLNKYGKKWGTRVGKTVLDNGTEVWSMAITDEMKDSVLTDGQPLYSLPRARNFSYQELTAKPDLQGKVIGNSQQVKMTSTGLVDEEWLVDLIKNKCASVRTKAPEPKYYVQVPDIERNVEITKKGIHHALIRNKLNHNGKVPDAVLVNARAMINLPEILANSIEVNRSQRGANIDVPFTRVMMGVTGIENASGIDEYYAVRIMVEERANQDPILVEANVLGKLYAVNAKKISNPHAQVTTKGVALTTDRLFSYSVADVLNDVKTVFDNTFSADVYQNLNASRKVDDFSSHLLHKIPVGEDTSPRALLSHAFEGVAQNDRERNKIQEYKDSISLINAEERKLRELREQIKELSFAKGPKDTKKIRSLQFEANQTANRINTYDRQLLRLEASAPLQNVLNREKEMARKRAEQKGKEALEAYREKAIKTQRELMDRWEKSRKKGIDSRLRTAMRHKIKDVVNELNQYLLKGTKDRHVPIGLQKAVAEALNAVNMDTVGAEERIAKLQAELMKAKTPEAIQEISKKIDNIREMGDRLDEKLKRLKTAYDEFINSDDPLIANSHDDAVSAHMMRLIVRVGDTPLREMTLDQLQDVYDVYKVVLATIRNANKSFKDNKNREISTRANQVMAEIDNLGVKRGKRPVFMSWIEKFGWDGLKPVYAMEHIGSQGLIDAYNNVRAGEDTWAQDIVEAREYYLEKFRKYKYDSWNFEKKYKFTSTTEKTFELTLDQIMSLYAYSKRDQAADHLKYGGIVFDPKTEVVEKTKSGIKVKYNVANATAYNISEETLADIISTLTDDQKGFVDEMQTYLSDVMGAKGNEVSLAMYDVKLFREKHYFPLKSAHQYMAKAKEQAQGEVKIKNSGFSKETKPHAKNPIVLSSFMDVWTSHVNEMSMYHAFVLPMEDFYRIYNYSTPSKNENMPTESVNAYIENAYGSAATGYIEQMLKDLNGGARSDSRTGFINKMMGLFKKGAVFASLSVVVQQPSAIARAAALVDTKYFIGPKVDNKRHKALWDEVKQYAPVAIIKEMGYFDTNMGKSTQDYIMGKEYSGFSEKMKALVTDSNYRDEILSKAPALADEIAWCSIWEAVKRETKAKYPGLDVKGEPFLMLAGSRFAEVITKTQVYDSVLSRSANMRSKDTGMKMATSFMAEPTTSINMIADALLQGKRGNKKYARAAIGAVIASQIFNSILVSFVYAGRDDDEDETYWEKYIGTLTGEILDSMNPATYIPFIKDIVSIVQGYDVERSDMAVISDLWNAIQNLSKDNVSVYRKVEGFAGSIAQIFGLPVKNIMRDVRGIYQTVMSFMNGQQTTKAGIGYAVKGAVTSKTVSDQQQLYEAILSGDKTQIARVKGRFKDQNAINSAIRKALRENDPRIKEAAQAKFSGDLDDYMRIAKAIIGEKHFSQDDVVAAINAEINLLDGEKPASDPKAKGMFVVTDFGTAVAQGDAAMANAAKTDIIRTAQKNGKTEEEAEKSFASSAKSELKELFQAGKITEQKTISALVSYCGLESDKAKADVQYWAFKKNYPDVYADDIWFDAYYEEVEDSGISIDMYMEYRNAVKDITGEGKKERRMAIIDSLPITSAQKDALYFAEGWAESKLYEAPWH